MAHGKCQKAKSPTGSGGLIAQSCCNPRTVYDAANKLATGRGLQLAVLIASLLLILVVLGYLLFLT